MGKQTSDTCKAIRDLVRRGELTRQQGKTLMGQCKHGDLGGAMKGLEVDFDMTMFDFDASEFDFGGLV